MNEKFVSGNLKYRQVNISNGLMNSRFPNLYTSETIHVSTATQAWLNKS